MMRLLTEMTISNSVLSTFNGIHSIKPMTASELNVDQRAHERWQTSKQEMSDLG